VQDWLARSFRCLTLVLAVILIFAILGGGLYLLLRNNAPAPSDSGSANISTKSLEQTAIGLYLQFHQKEITQPLSDDPTVVPFRVNPGETLSTIAIRLQNAGLISDEQIFRLLARYLGVDDRLEAGDYRLRRNMTMEEIISQMQHGILRAQSVTIPEGWRLEQIAQLLAKEAGINEAQFLALARDGGYDAAQSPYAFLRERPTAVKSLEGYLFPDTYEISQDTDAQKFVELMLKNFDQRVTAELRQSAKEMKWSLYDVVTLAAIVEREAIVNEERPIIASVYLNRLNKGMYLQADPTVQYAKGFSTTSLRWWSQMTGAEMQTTKSAYNTYLNPGLPPGPICNPGLASIKAVLSPANSTYLFFFAKGDGSHAFAETYEEHLANIRKYGQ
jgi:UPF0755 protein